MRPTETFALLSDSDEELEYESDYDPEFENDEERLYLKPMLSLRSLPSLI
jgi:hypothetical protein